MTLEDNLSSSFSTNVLAHEGTISVSGKVSVLCALCELLSIPSLPLSLITSMTIAEHHPSPGLIDLTLHSPFARNHRRNTAVQAFLVW
jgi:hypothetical protein